MNQTDIVKPSLLMIGGGKMAQALLTGFYKHQLLDINKLIIIEPHEETQRFLVQNNLVIAENIVASVEELHQKIDCKISFDFIFLAIKPQIFTEVGEQLQQISSLIKNAHVISIMAGITIAKIAYTLQILPVKIIRTMPNTPAMIGKGLTGIYMQTNKQNILKNYINELFSAVGQTLWLDAEKQLDDITALSGSGPAYIFHLLEVWQQTAQNYGFDEKTAQMIAWQTIDGAIALAQEQNFTTLKQNVTSHKGTTASALDYLYEHQWGDIFTQAIAQAKKRSEELSSII